MKTGQDCKCTDYNGKFVALISAYLDSFTGGQLLVFFFFGGVVGTYYVHGHLQQKWGGRGDRHLLGTLW